MRISEQTGQNRAIVLSYRNRQGRLTVSINERTLFCLFSQCAICCKDVEKKHLVLMWDSSYVCKNCKSHSREESLDEYRSRQALLNRLDEDDEDDCFEPIKCPLCKTFITESRRWVRTSNTCRKCHRGLRNGIRPEGSWFQDARGRMLVASKDPSRPVFAYGEGNLPRCRVILWTQEVSLAKHVMQNQQARCWNAVEQYRPMAVSLFKGNEDLVSDIGYKTIGRCALTYDSTQDVKFTTFLYAALERAQQRYLKQLSYMHELPSDLVANSFEASIEASDELSSLGLTKFELWLLEQRLVYKRKMVDIAWELKVSTGTVRKHLLRVTRLLSPLD